MRTTMFYHGNTPSTPKQRATVKLIESVLGVKFPRYHNIYLWWPCHDFIRQHMARLKKVTQR